jgi:porphobilinogen synthase
MFVHDGTESKIAIDSMPNTYRFNTKSLIEEVKKVANLGIPAIALFPNIDQSKKTPDGEEAANPKNLICEATRAIKKAVPNIGIIGDIALDPYTTHGHDGVVVNGDVDNDKTIEILQYQAHIQAEAGCDILAPSDMMDGRIGAIRKTLEEKELSNIQIMAYAAKYASAFYGPFRDAVGSASDVYVSKKSYQMDYANSEEALREVALDIAEGADSIIIKPGMAYLDIIRMVRDEFSFPTFAYQVSGEYSMFHAAAEKGLLDLDAIMIESLTAFKRAGATGILTYFAVDMAQKLK